MQQQQQQRRLAAERTAVPGAMKTFLIDSVAPTISMDSRASRAVTVSAERKVTHAVAESLMVRLQTWEYFSSSASSTCSESWVTNGLARSLTS